MSPKPGEGGGPWHPRFRGSVWAWWTFLVSLVKAPGQFVWARMNGDNPRKAERDRAIAEGKIPRL